MLFIILLLLWWEQKWQILVLKPVCTCLISPRPQNWEVWPSGLLRLCGTFRDHEGDGRIRKKPKLDLETDAEDNGRPSRWRWRDSGRQGKVQGLERVASRQKLTGFHSVILWSVTPSSFPPLQEWEFPDSWFPRYRNVVYFRCITLKVEVGGGRESNEVLWGT